MSAIPKCDRCGHRRDHTRTLDGHEHTYTGAYECMVKNVEFASGPWTYCPCFDYIKDGKRADGSPSECPVTEGWPDAN